MSRENTTRWKNRLHKAAKNLTRNANNDGIRLGGVSNINQIVEDCINESGNQDNIETQIHREALQKASTILEEALEDSPMTRERLKQGEQQLENLTSSLRRIVKLAKQYHAAGTAFREISQAFGQELFHFDFGEIPTILGEQLKNYAKSIGETVININNFHTMFIFHLQNVFTQPMEQFLKEDIKESKEFCKQHARTRTKYDQALSKFSHIKKTDVEKIPEAEHELFYIRKEFQQSCLEHASKLNRIQTLSKIQLMERSCAFLHAERDFFNLGFFFLIKYLRDVCEKLTLFKGTSLHIELDPKLGEIASRTASVIFTNFLYWNHY